MEYITDGTKQPIPLTTFIVSSIETSPDDLCFFVTINNEKIIRFERKASRRCVCQVFYRKEGVNWWKTTLAFCPEGLLEVSQDSKLTVGVNILTESTYTNLSLSLQVIHAILCKQKVKTFYNELENDKDPPVGFYMPYEDKAISAVCDERKGWQIDHSKSHQVHAGTCTIFCQLYL